MSTFSLVIDAKGRVVLPRSLRRSVNLSPGDRLVGTLEGQRIVLETPAAVQARVWDSAGEAVPTPLPQSQPTTAAAAERLALSAREQVRSDEPVDDVGEQLLQDLDC